MMIVGLCEMLRNATLRIVVGLGSLLFGGHLSMALADTIDTRGMAPHEQCGYCHEYDGNSRMPNFPKLAGQNRGYLMKQMLDFKHGRRDGKGIMQEAVAQLSAQEIQEVAAYFAKQEGTTEKNKLDPADRELAAKIYRKGIAERQVSACINCHNPGQPDIPVLSGQHARYLADQLHAFRRGERTNDGMVMRQIATGLTVKEVAVLSEYLAAGMK